VLEEAGERGLEVVDTTCPIVTRAQQWAKKLVDEGFAVIVYGDPEHKETRGILGWARGKAIVLRSADDIASLPEGLPSRVGVLVQTTHTEANFAAFVNRLLTTRMDHISELRVINTLCGATTGQQAAARELAHMADVVVVVGGKESANTRHLREVCEEEGTRAYHIETPDELRPEWFADVARVGVTAGASTPDYAVDEVVTWLERLAAAEAKGTKARVEPSPKPSLRDLIARRDGGETSPVGLTPDERDRVERWRDASMEEHGRALADLLDFVDAMGRRPREREMFPGFRALVRRAGDGE
jgi:4-hydroxy-3-methylbut-2-enyl diphosphate reductase